MRLESSKTIDLVRFVDASEIDYRFFEKPYFLVPADEHSAEAFAVVREALRKSGKVGLAQLATHGREHLVAVAPLEEGMVVEVLRYADELREPKGLYDDFDGKPAKDMVDLATQIIEKKSGPFKPGEFEDHYGEAVRDLVARKRKGQKLVAAEEPAQQKGQVIDLMDALRRSMGKGGSSSSKAEGKKATSGKRHRTAAARTSERGAVKRARPKTAAKKNVKRAS